ncbi:MAG TPA: dodecin domain-containing protein [Deltaproteobacteria bacterium]|nr:MAG: transporter [delta proteobacterium MLS_D]HET58203.1 dodecin domain-containing protein [Deltaproteobacteria bacterium]
MMESVYKVIELVGTSDQSWEEAAKGAIEKASKSLKDLRVAEVKELDIKVEDGKFLYRAKISVSFKYLD